MLEILRQILREPTLPESEFEVMKNEEIAGIEQGRTDPMRLGVNRIQRLLAKYPADDVRYVPTIDEQLERIKKVTLDQVRTLYREYLGADHGELVVVGDFEPSEILPILAKTLDGWKAEKPYARIEHPLQPDIKPERETIETPDKENAIYLAGLQTPSRTAIPITPPWSPATSSWGAVPSPLGSPIDSARRGGSRTPRCRCSRRTRSSRTPR